jgi:hypothetical protein
VLSVFLLVAAVALALGHPRDKRSANPHGFGGALHSFNGRANAALALP